MFISHFMGGRRYHPGPAGLMAVLFLAVICPIANGGDRRPRAKTPPKDHTAGRELFVKEWEAGKQSPAGGDGLGPLYNETSCVACHRLGGIGGGGGNEQNVKLLTAVARPTGSGQSSGFEGELPELHAGFLGGSSIVLHRHATAPALRNRLEEIGSWGAVSTHAATLDLRQSSRNTPAVFGAGLIDAIPDEVLRVAEQRRFPDYPDVRGRVGRLPDGRLGRFGWKAQMASLRDFVLAACANELGLEVPGHHQARLDRPGASEPADRPLDMTESESDQLIEFVAGLSPPVLRPVREDRPEPWGYAVFERVGCATCHTPRLGTVNGLYSDLLLHDMGESLADAATYYGSSGSPGSPAGPAEAREMARAAGAPALPSEWRTPPLWGVADSAPYLHDGRAPTLDYAISLHRGEARASAERYARLARGDKRLLLRFLHSLTVAPPRDRRAEAIRAVQARSHPEAASGPGG